MNYGEYIRRLNRKLPLVTHSPNGQDASQVTLKNQALAVTVPKPIAVATTFSKPGGSIANINTIQSAYSIDYNGISPGETIKNLHSAGYVGVANGITNANTSGNIIGSAQNCAVRSDALSSQPYSTVIPERTNVSTLNELIVPGNLKCCMNDYGIKYTDNAELIADKGRQSAIRSSYNLPNKLQGIRGPVW